MKNSKIGKVYLVGAGPGDPGLITVKGKQLLERAEVVVYDYLANIKLLNHVPADAELIYVGKKGGGIHAETQEGINQILVDQAMTGKRVVRLKGGDPFIFGRGGEEIEELAKHGVEFEIVPGVTAASAAATYAGIPITHRHYTATVAFVTGHEDPNKQESSIDWEKLSTGIGTIVFYMGIKNLPNITERLIRYGRAPETPVAVIRWASTPEHRTVTGTLATIVDVVNSANIKPPALIIVGEVVKLRETMNWFEKKPLLGKRIMVTRTRDQASDLVLQLEELGADCVEFATIALEPPDTWDEIDLAVDTISRFDWLLFTSINAIQFFFQRLFARQMDARTLCNIKIAAVGVATAAELQKYGLKADLLPSKEFTGEGLAETLIKQGAGTSRFLLPRALKANEALPDILRQAGAEVTVAPVYQNIRPKGREAALRQEFIDHAIDMVTFTSSSTFTNFIYMLNPKDDAEMRQLLQGVKIASIGPVTGKAIIKKGLTIDVQPSECYSIATMVQSITEHYLANKQPD
ncbi:MAG: uroporphyrinogen-III C-methyltransferase [Desulfobulbaceae bacterium]|nr:uroporphyrinogen-III C-methyltransferase [Desulfobulbaceae bacterium]